MLVDFGAVRSLSHQPGQAQTVLGTPGAGAGAGHGRGDARLGPVRAGGDAGPRAHPSAPVAAAPGGPAHLGGGPARGRGRCGPCPAGAAGAGGCRASRLCPRRAGRAGRGRACTAIWTRGAARSGWPRAGAGGARVRGGDRAAVRVAATRGRRRWRLREAEVMQALAVRRPTVENAASWTMKQLTSPWQSGNSLARDAMRYWMGMGGMVGFAAFVAASTSYLSAAGVFGGWSPQQGSLGRSSPARPVSNEGTCERSSRPRSPKAAW